MDNNGFKQKISRLNMEIELLEKIIRKNGWTVRKHSKGCTCTPAKFYNIDKKYIGFAPSVENACYHCENCGEPLFCDTCIRNYNMKISSNAQKSLEYHRKDKK